MQSTVINITESHML